MKTLAILGGSFDPVHWGHIHIAEAVMQHFQFDELTFLPCRLPALKGQTHSADVHRLAMLKLALADFPQWTINLSEMQRSTPSYMVDTLDILKELRPDWSLVLIVGMDAFVDLPRWHRWQHLLDKAKLLVVSRPDYELNLAPELADFVKNHQANSKKQFVKSEQGSIYFYNAGLYPVSSTAIRTLIGDSKGLGEYLPKTVIEYIQQNKLYS